MQRTQAITRIAIHLATVINLAILLVCAGLLLKSLADVPAGHRSSHKSAQCEAFKCGSAGLDELSLIVTNH